jgi:hypothetical protein
VPTHATEQRHHHVLSVGDVRRRCRRNAPKATVQSLRPRRRHVRRHVHGHPAGTAVVGPMPGTALGAVARMPADDDAIRPELMTVRTPLRACSTTAMPSTVPSATDTPGRARRPCWRARAGIRSLSGWRRRAFRSCHRPGRSGWWGLVTCHRSHLGLIAPAAQIPDAAQRVVRCLAGSVGHPANLAPDSHCVVVQRARRSVSKGLSPPRS